MGVAVQYLPTLFVKSNDKPNFYSTKVYRGETNEFIRVTYRAWVSGRKEKSGWPWTTLEGFTQDRWCPPPQAEWMEPPSLRPLSLYTLAALWYHVQLGQNYIQWDRGVVWYSGEGPLTVLAFSSCRESQESTGQLWRSFASQGRVSPVRTPDSTIIS